MLAPTHQKRGRGSRITDKLSDKEPEVPAFGMPEPRHGQNPNKPNSRHALSQGTLWVGHVPKLHAGLPDSGGRSCREEIPRRAVQREAAALVEGYRGRAVALEPEDIHRIAPSHPNAAP